MGHTPPRSADLLILGLPRAGTTLLANLLTTPPDRWIIVEPGVTRAGMDDQTRRQAVAFGFEIRPAEWCSASDHEEPEARFDRVLAPRVATLQKWGIKEVNPRGWSRLIEKFKPRCIIFAVRDITDATLSAHRKLAVQRRPDQDDNWLYQRMTESASALVKTMDQIPASRRRVARFEDLVSSSTLREELSRWLDWPMDGDPTRGLVNYGREEEASMHGGAVTARSLMRERQNEPPERLAFADRVRCSCVTFQARFGYVDRIIQAPEKADSPPE